MVGAGRTAQQPHPPTTPTPKGTHRWATANVRDANGATHSPGHTTTDSCAKSADTSSNDNDTSTNDNNKNQMTIDDFASFIAPPAEWMRHAACRHHPTRLWFPERGEPTHHAKNICNTCPVKQDCLEYALEIPNCVGIWGGMSGRQRRQIRKPKNKPIKHGTPVGYQQHRRRGEQACPACREAHTAAVTRRKHNNQP